jgi:hypothetical protein
MLTATNEVSSAVPTPSNESEEETPIYLNQPIVDQPEIERIGKFFMAFPSNRHL